ncbi:MAG: FtsX-like permease family protein [Bacillota bacterium]|nr:FtsX-like permease family protein [Bacillota bacterium]
MIGSYKQLTGRYLKANKKRSILTVIGIVLSVALISSIGFFVQGVQDAEVQSMKDQYGSWHVAYKNINEDLISKVINNPKIARSGLYQEDAEIKLSDSFSMVPTIATDKALELLPYRIKEGRMPEKQGEVAIEKWSLKYVNKDAKLGSKIILNNKEYTLTGILEDSTLSQMNRKGILLSISNNIDKSKSMLLAEVSSKTNLKKAVKELMNLAPKANVMTNSMLLTMEGAGVDDSANTGFLIPVCIIIGIVVISTIAVIYNSFQISVVERIKQFGLLRAVGTTPKQIRKIVLREATILALIAIPLGLVCGIIAIYGIIFTFKVIGADSVMPMKISISSLVLLISTLVGLASVYISALIPAFFAGRISPLVAINSRTSITKEKIKRRRNPIISKIFKFEGALAAKNIKRNRKRYRITVFSIVISVMLFVTFKSFMDMTLTIANTPNESSNTHFSILDSSQNTIDDTILNSITSLSSVDKVYKGYLSYNFNEIIDSNKEINQVKELGNVYQSVNVNGNNKTLMQGSIAVYDNNSLEAAKKYVESGTIDISKMNSEKGVIVIDRDAIYNSKTKKTYMGPAANVKAGDEIKLQYSEKGIEQDGKLKLNDGKIETVKVLAVLKDEPFNFNGVRSGIKIITTDEVAESLIGKKGIKPAYLNITIKNVKEEDSVKTQLENIIKDKPSLQIVNNLDQNRREKSALLMIQILIYGFVVVVSLIGSVNIINTLTTNIILRKREFASLKCIGLTQKGLKKMIVLEGLLYGIVGTIYGSIIACGLSYLMYRGMNGLREFGWKIPWTGIGIAAVAAIVIGYLSVLSPLSRIKKENLIEAVREDF